MNLYAKSGVDVNLGDRCSKIAYESAKNTFIGRKGMIGEPVVDDGGFAGAIDMGDFFLIQNDDGVGSKMIIGERINKLDTLGYDLIAMVADDAICVGAETISITNTLDVNKADEDKVRALMAGLETVALEQKIIIPGGEIAELPAMANGYIWNATAVGILGKDKLIDTSKIEVGDKIIGLKSALFRSNGFSLVRKVLFDALGDGWFFEKYNAEMTWGEVLLTPSIIYSSAVLDMHGRYGEPSKVELKGVAHITGGGIPGNIIRILKKSGLGAKLDKLPEPPEAMKKVIEMGNVGREDAFSTWNMGIGMMIVSNDVDKIIEIAKNHNIDAVEIGEIVPSGLTY